MQSSERELPDPREAQDMIKNLNESWFARKPLSQSTSPQEGFPTDMSPAEIADHIIVDFLRWRDSNKVLVPEPEATRTVSEPQSLSFEGMPEEEKPRTVADYLKIFLVTAIPAKQERSEDDEAKDLFDSFRKFKKAHADNLRKEGNLSLAQALVDFQPVGLPIFADENREQYVDLYDRRDDNFTGDILAHWSRISRVAKKACEQHSRKR